MDLFDIRELLATDPSVLSKLKGDGDFRSEECIELLKEADIVCTNPPFSLFREYLAQLVEHDKKFLIVGNKNAITYKETFTLIKENKMWLGMRNVNQDMWLLLTDRAESYEKIVHEVDSYGQNVPRKSKHINAIWLTNLEHRKRHERFLPYKNYTPEEFPKYDNYDAIEVGKVVDIPQDYDGVMGVPITFLDKYNPEQFEILGMCENEDLYRLKTRVYTSQECKRAYMDKFNKAGTYDLNASGVLIKNGIREKTYARVLIRFRKS